MSRLSNSRTSSSSDAHSPRSPSKLRRGGIDDEAAPKMERSGCGFPEEVVVLRAEFGGSSPSAQNDKQQQSNSKSKSRSPFLEMTSKKSNYDNCGY
jgi:hypothetical protein